MSANLYSTFFSRFSPKLDKPAFVLASGKSYSFGDIDDLSARFAAVLRNAGVGADDRVVVQAEKSIGAVALYLACLRLGAVYTPLNTAYTAAEVDYFIGDCAPKLVVLTSARDGANAVVKVLTDEGAGLWAEALATPPYADLASRQSDAIAAILYTSGTTGRSKGAMLSIGNLLSNAQTLVKLWGFREGDVLLHALPIFHVHGLFVATHCALLNASTSIFLPKFDPAEICRLLPQATVMMGVPTFYTRLLATPAFTRELCANMRLFISGSAPLLAETHREFSARTGHAILERYGMTETGMITSNPLNGARVPGTVGFPLPDVSVRVVGENGAIAEDDAPGVIELSGPNVFKGYWRMPEKTREEFRHDGYFITGDIATRAADGRISIVGRAKDLIISGGYNIYPKEIEDVLDAVPGVIESAIVGAPHPDFGEAVVAVIATRGVDQAALEHAAHEKLARFKHPRRYVLLDDLPRNAMGKVQKAALRQAYKDAFKA